MLALLGTGPARARADAGRVLALETRLAEASMTRAERRDPRAVYHRMPLAELAGLAPAFPWAVYLEALGVAPETVLVRQPGFFRAFSALVRDLPLAHWKAYLRWHAASALAPCLGAAFEREDFAFYGTVLGGTPRQGPRWKRVQDQVEQGMGEALGRLYVARAFSPGARDRARDLVANLQAALAARIRDLDWMGPATRAAALAKLDALSVKIGYPDRWRDYAALRVARSGYAGNVLAARVFESRRNLARLGRPVDRDEWEMTPATVNAYYNPLHNEIVFPAGILQPPFFDPEADDAANYGAIGMVIGHELTHGFDDQGRQYDARGNLRDWWTPEDSAAFRARTEPLVRRFDALETLPGVPLDGRLTLGENLADLGGLKLAFDAWRRSLQGRPRPADRDGFTAEQRFFLSYAQSWRFRARDEAARLRAVTDPHAPPRFRVNVPLADLPEFHEAFGCPQGEAMHVPERDRPAIW
jgi:predicted metalloendopeptidase